MNTTLEIAAQILPHFRENVLRGWVRTYGHYAAAIGRDGAKEGVVVGKAMHVLGAACIIARVPVAPIHFVERADGEWRGIFEKAASESIHVLPAWNTLAVTSRIYPYTEQDFDLLQKLLRELIPKHFTPKWQTPRNIWIYLIHAPISGETTWLNRALTRYEEILCQAKKARDAG